MKDPHPESTCTEASNPETFPGVKMPPSLQPGDLVKLLRSLVSYILLLAFSQFAAAQSVPDSALSNSQPLLGYTPRSTATERELEKKFQDTVVVGNIRENMRRLSARPHNVGSPYDKDNAEWILARFKEWGLDAHIENFDVLFPTPKERIVELVAPTKFRAKLHEPALSIDPTSNQVAEQLPTYNAYSIDGDVTGPLVYVNYGIPEDYEQLDRLGISVKGAIVIARYGGGGAASSQKSPPSTAPSAASSIPTRATTATFRATSFPRGLRPDGWRAARQRHGHADLSRRSAHAGRRRDHGRKAPDVKEAQTITKIPVLPISYGDAQPLLAALTGPSRRNAGAAACRSRITSVPVQPGSI